MNQLCAKRIECECLDFPISNYTAEGPDTELFCVTRFHGEPPPLGGVNGACANSTLVPSVSASCCLSTLRLAEICAEQGAQIGTWQTWTDPDDPNCQPVTVSNGVFYNVEQTYDSTCPDGSIFTNIVPAGLFVALTQAEADAQALSFAQAQASTVRFCCVGIICACKDEAFSETITISDGTGAFTWTPVDGALPAGVTYEFLDAENRSIRFYGTPTDAATTTITYQITDSLGHYLTRTFTFYVRTITTTTLPDFTTGTAYAHFLVGVNTTSNGLSNPLCVSTTVSLAGSMMTTLLLLYPGT